MTRMMHWGNAPVRLQQRTNLHLTRKVWHLTMGVLILAVYSSLHMNRWTASVTLASLLACALLFERTRLRNRHFNQMVARLFSPIMRACEMDRVSGIPAYLGGVFVAVLIFPEPVAIASILCLAVADPMASLVGILYGDRTIRFSNGKSLAGTLAGILASAFVLFAVFAGLGLPLSALAWIVAIGAVAGGTAELLPLGIDDNFSIPVLTGFTVWLAYLLVLS